MQTWTDAQLVLARARMEEREAEAAAARLAASATPLASSAGLRGAVGRALIRAGQALADDPMVARAHGRRLAARQP